MLFRQKVSEYLQSRQSGQVLLLTGWPAWVTVTATLAAFSALLFFLIYGTFTRRVTVTGEVTTWPHTVNLFAPEQGTVSRLLVTPGQVVEAGAPLYQLDTSRVSTDGNLSTATLSLLNQQLRRTDEVIAQLEKNRQATLDALNQQLAQALQARDISAKMLASATRGVQLMQRSMENYDNYRQRGLITTDQQSNQRYLFYQQQNVWQNLNSQRLQQNLQILTLRSEMVTKTADFDTQIAQYRLRRDDSARQIAEAQAGSSRVIAAPYTGRVSSLSVTEGQMVVAGDSLAQLVPSLKPTLKLILWLPNTSIPYVQPGESVNIRFTAYPSDKYGQFSATLETVSSATVPPAELAAWGSAPRRQNGQSAEGWFKAIAAIEPSEIHWQGKTLPLTAGMQVQATLFLEKRPLYKWMFAPYYSLKESLSEPVNDKK